MCGPVSWNLFFIGPCVAQIALEFLDLTELSSSAFWVLGLQVHTTVPTLLSSHSPHSLSGKDLPDLCALREEFFSCLSYKLLTR